MTFQTSLAALSLMFAPYALAQWTHTHSMDHDSPLTRDGAGKISGQISFDVPVAGTLTVELSNGSGQTVSTVARADGYFEFEGVVAGAYELRLTGAGGQVVHEESALVTGGYQNLVVQVNLRSNNVPDGTVSIRQLQHKVPGPARKEFDRASAAAGKGDHTAALEHFQKAVAFDPDFADGFNGLGSEYLATGQPEAAVEQYQKAVDLVPDHALAVPNLCIVLYKLKRYHEAGELARRALRLRPTLLQIRYILAVSLIADGGDRKEALDNLDRSASLIPEAHLLSAKILAEGGDRDRAIKHLNDYLAAAQPNATGRDKAQAWLAQLQN